MDSQNVKISIIMPVYNAGEYLTTAINSILCQSFDDFELICVDDGSTDSSAVIIKKFMAKDGRIKSVRQSNAGPGVARNTGVEIACGKYIIFLDADDFYEKNLLSSLYGIAEDGNLDVAVAKFDIYNDNKNVYSLPTDEPHSNIFASGHITSKNEYPDYILSSTTGYAWNKLFRSSFIHDKMLAFDPELYVFEDVLFVCSALSMAERVGRIDDVLIHHRVYSEQSRSRLFRKYYGQVPVIYKKLKDFLMHRGMYIPLKKGYLNFSAERCYKIYNLLWEDGKENLWNMLHDEYVAEFEWITHDKTAFESMDVYEFVANVSLYTYREFVEREEQGKNINVDLIEKEDVEKKVNQNQKISRRREIIKRIFRAKKRNGEM